MSRQTELAQIHIAKKQLAMDDDTYRMMLENITGKNSTQNMDISERHKVLAHLKSIGFKAKRGKKRLSPKSGMGDQRDKIRAIWIDMGKAGFIQDSSENALDAWVKRMTSQHELGQVDSITWLRKTEQAQFVLEALKKWQRRLEIKEAKQVLAKEMLVLMNNDEQALLVWLNQSIKGLECKDFESFISKFSLGKLELVHRVLNEHVGME